MVKAPELGEDGLFRPALALMAGRWAAFAVAFILPVVLVRLLTPAPFGASRPQGT